MISVLAILDVGSGEIMWILLIAVLLFGGDKLPGFARGLGRAVNEFKKAKGDVEREISRALHETPVEPPRPQPPQSVQQVISPQDAKLYPELAPPEPQVPRANPPSRTGGPESPGSQPPTAS